jgi:serine/threonine protein kinase
MLEGQSCSPHPPGEALARKGARCLLPFLSIPLKVVQIDHPFVVNLRFAFQDTSNCFFVLDFMSGGSLRRAYDPRGCHTVCSPCSADHLKTQGRFSEQAVLCWTAELASAVAYLHTRGIIHRWVRCGFQPLRLHTDSLLARDLKPDNILLDCAGHAHISDFNIAVYTRDMNRPHTTVAGSVAYMAPEVLNEEKAGYRWEIDWWSLGVITYELLWHVRPFDGPSSEAIIAAIRSEKPAMVPPVIHGAQPVSHDACDAIRRVKCTVSLSVSALLTMFYSVPEQKTFQTPRVPLAHVQLARHTAASVVCAYELEGPWGKDARNAIRASRACSFLQCQGLLAHAAHDQEDEANFDLKYEWEAFVQSKKPLSYKKSIASPNVSRSNDPDLSQLEELFTVYDYRVPSAPRDPWHQHFLSRAHQPGIIRDVTRPHAAIKPRTQCAHSHPLFRNQRLSSYPTLAYHTHAHIWYIPRIPASVFIAS